MMTPDHDEVERLRAAIRKHRDYRGDDRCYEDDGELYRVLPEGYNPVALDTSIDLNQCALFKFCRANPATKYTSPQRRIEVLEAALRHYADQKNWTGQGPSKGTHVAVQALIHNKY